MTQRLLQYHSRELVLGLDFGSSSTVAGVLIGDQVQLVQEHGDPAIPSVVYLPDRGPPEIGRSAVAQQMTEPSKVIRSVKRVLGQPADSELVRHYVAGVPYRIERSGDRLSYKFRSGNISPEQIAGMILGRIRELAESRFGAKIRKMVMTMSAVAPDGYRDAAIRAARLARLEVLEFVAEPIAGTLALDLSHHNVRRRIVVCDFGGGTFDVSAVAQDGLGFTPIATHGDHYLGGDDLDDALAEAIARIVFRSHHFDMHKDVVRWNELLLRCESAKRQLSSLAEAPLAMRDAYLETECLRDLSLVLDLAWAEVVWAPQIARGRAVVEELLRRAGWQVADVDVVGLIGGSSHVRSFRAALVGMFGNSKLLIAPDAVHAVARGATMLTARHRKERTDRIPILLDA